MKRIHQKLFIIILFAAATVLIFANRAPRREASDADAPAAFGQSPTAYSPGEPSFTPKATAAPVMEPTPAMQKATPTFAPNPTPEPEPEVPQITAWPTRLIIEALGVEAEIIGTGYDAENDSMVIYDSAHIVSWYTESAIPGNDGNSFFGGHNKWRGEEGKFLRLDALSVGDAMEVYYDDGTALTFYCESVFVYALATAPADLIMRPGGEARVTLITCKDPFNHAIGTSDYRIVAVFKESGVFEIPDPPLSPFPTVSG